MRVACEARPRGDRPDRARLVTAVRALARASRTLELASDELSLAQYRVLAAIASGEERASWVASRLAIGKPAVSALVESLSRRGLLDREVVASDQRAVALRVTREGAAVLARAEGAMAERLQAVLERCEERAEILASLGRLGELLEARAAEHRARHARPRP